MESDDQLAVRRRLLRSRLLAVDALLAETPDPTRGKLSKALRSNVSTLLAEAKAITEWSACAATDRRADDLASQALALSNLLAARDRGVDGGICAIADGLLDSVGDEGGPAWGAVTVPGAGTAINQEDHIIRLGTGMLDVWALPIVLHELGHFVGRRVEVVTARDKLYTAVERPFEQELANTDAERMREYFHLDELFADAYAAYVGGPSYLGCCVTVGFNPSGHAQDSPTHPSADRRVAVIAETLRRMDCAAQSGRRSEVMIGAEVDGWLRRWAVAVNDAGGAVGADADDARIVDICWRVLNDNLEMSRYRTHATALKLSARLVVDDAGGAGVSMRDIVNAAWIVRLKRPGDSDATGVTQRALLDGMVNG